MAILNPKRQKGLVPEVPGQHTRYIEPSSPGQETPLLLITEAAANKEEHVTCLWHTSGTL